MPTQPTPLLMILALAACSAPSPGDVGTEDTGSRSDAGADGGPTDGGPTADAPELDAPLSPGFLVEPPLPHPLQEISVAVFDGRLVVAGGIDEGVTIVREVWAFDGSSWTALPDLPAPRHHGMLVPVGGTLYFVGGMASLRFEPLDTVFALEAGASAWTTVLPLPHPLAAAVGVEVGSELVLVGGQTDRGLATTGLVGDPATGLYRDTAPLPLPREHVAGFSRGTEVWVVAGRDFRPSASTDRVHVYDVPTNAWREGPALRHVRGGHSATLVPTASGERAAIAGGEIEGEALSSFELLDPMGTSSDATPLPTPRHGHGAALFLGRLYLVGGADRPLFGATDSVESWAP